MRRRGFPISLNRCDREGKPSPSCRMIPLCLALAREGCSRCKGNPLMPRLSVSDSASAPDTSSAYQCVFCLLMRLPPPDASSAFRCVFRLQMQLPLRDSSSAPRPVSRTASHHGPVFCLPSHSIPWLPGLPPPFRNIPQCLAQSAQHPPWHPLHCYVFHCTAAHSGHTARLPPLCRILWLHYCVSRHSAMPSGCSALPTRCAMSHDVA